MVKLNKAALAVLALGVAGVANAAMYAPPPSMTVEEPTAKHGFYVGIGLGGIGFESQMSGQASGTINGIADTGVSLGNADGGNYGLNSYLLGGYAWTFPNKVFIAGEIFGNLTNVPVSTNASFASVSDPGLDTVVAGNGGADLTLDGVYGIRALPGYQVTPSSVVYGIIGYARAHAGSDVYGNATADVGPFPEVTGSASSSESYNFNGLQLGLGSMINVTHNIALRGDLIWTGYGKQTLVSGSAGSNDPDDIGAIQGDLQADPTTIEADVGVVYMFD